jgi:hypothetical protein
MAGISVERSSYRPRTIEPLIALPRTMLTTSDRVRNTQAVVDRIDTVLSYEKPGENADLGQWVSYFDTSHQKEGLSSDWHNLHTKEGKAIGFSMKGQMALLEDASDKKAVYGWAQKTKQDLLGFKLEYLSDHLVYPCKYEWNGGRLENKDYGNKDIEETVSAQERNGSVKKALKDMKEFFRTAPDGAIAVMTSPKGDSGLATDAGEMIAYPDSYFFMMQKNGDKVINYTLKTDFTVHECREAIERMTGEKPSLTATMEDYTKTIAKIKPGEKNVQDVSDVVKLLKGERGYAHENIKGEKTGWGEVYADIKQGEKLYNFNKKTQQAIDSFEAYCRGGSHTKEELQKAVAATILRMSKLFYEDEEAKQKVMRANSSYHPVSANSSFGDIMGAVAERPGCAGGGGNSGRSILIGSAGGDVVGIAGDGSDSFLKGIFGSDERGSLMFRCKRKHINTRPRGGFRPKCSTCHESVRC